MGKRENRRLTPGSGDAATVCLVTAGQVLDNHYKLVREVARGGMGVVFEAEDVRLEGRRVAVKVLPAEVGKDEGAILRLKREASSVCVLDHPNVVRLVEFNAEGDVAYLVMEYLDGDNLSVHLARAGTLPVDEVLAIARDVLPALAFAHEQNVVHRDVKPANLMFKTVGSRRVTKVTDFGIAYQIKDSMTRLTGQDSAGTLLYIAPEQLRGKKPSPASDQYSFAATLYELLSGEPPFTGAGLSHQILEATPEPLSDVPGCVNDAIMKALSKEPEGRFSDCEAFLEALEGRGAVAGGAGADKAGAVSPLEGRRSGGWAGTVLVLVLVALAAAGGWSLRGRPSGPGGAVAPAAPDSSGHRAGETWTNSLGMSFSWCPPGEFGMGFESDIPVHRVRIGRGFWIGTHEVTQGQWRTVMGANPAKFQGGSEDDRRPVEQVNWNDCQEFARRLGASDGSRYRLPSEAEWDYACRAGGDLSWASEPDSVAWLAATSGRMTHPVGQKRPNPWGLYDMVGNVWEWCQDTWHMDVSAAPTDGSAWEGGNITKVLRGGGYDRTPAFWRDCSVPDAAGYHSYGLRLVATPRADAKGLGVPPVTGAVMPSQVGPATSVQTTAAGAPTPAPVAATLPPVPVTSRVTFESDPPGAKVYGVELPPERKYVGRTGEGVVAIDLEPGTWTFKYVLAGCRDAIRTVEVGADGSSQTIRETLVEQQGFIDVTVVPAGAVVTLDGKPVVVSRGRRQVRAAPGRHVVAASREGFEDATETVTVADGATVSSRLVLKEKPTGPPPVPAVGRVGETWTSSVGMKFSWCPPGEFDMGSPASEVERFQDEGPVHRVRIPRGFWLGSYEVTQAEWQEIMGSNPSYFKGGGRLPVEQVSWIDCQEFLRKLAARDGDGYRLPSEAEWQYACRAGATGPRYGELDAVAWYENSFTTRPQLVGGKSSNAWGLYDMLGNVWEWCQDTWNDTYSGAPTDGSAWDGGSGYRVILGGSWFNPARSARAACRSLSSPDDRRSHTGVRVVAFPRTVGQVGGSAAKDQVGFIDVTVQPADAVVTLDGERCVVAGGRGQIRVTPGRHVVSASREGFEDTSQTVTVADEETVSSRLVLKEKPAGPKVGDSWTNAIGMKFSWCPPGEFEMGGAGSEPARLDNEGPVHRVRIDRGFWLGSHEVTQRQWQAVMGSNPARFKGDDRRPVEMVSWGDCQDFLKRLSARDGNGYRLPSEAEWEYACRAGTTGARHGDLDAVAWHHENSGGTTQPVGGKQRNAWGLYDMLGNVCEWCQDAWHDNYAGAPGDGSVWDDEGGNRVLRGDSWSGGCSGFAWRYEGLHEGFEFLRLQFNGLRVVVVPKAP